mgnify:CR=1 FL=1
MQSIIWVFCARCNGPANEKSRPGMPVRARTMAGAIRKATIMCDCKPRVAS